MYVRLLKDSGNSICVNNFQYLPVKPEDKRVLNKFIDEEYLRKLHSMQVNTYIIIIEEIKWNM